ncbi:DegT/DnrJ/EryC1/StrS family aminotransferase [Cohnella fermenti]|nr:DegT/DnrJ/EryC1/StrS family aminotransferase [Cohnella fermenti]
MREIEKIWEVTILSNHGPIHNQFEAALKSYLNAKHLSLFVNGHMALEIAIKTLDLQGEVITTPFTFASTAHAISNCGLTPVFCDINPNDYNIDVTKIEELITEKTSAIVPVHVYGTPCDVNAIQRIAKKHGLKVIYDAAHAFGVSVNGVDIGNFGDISMFSFHATKVFHSIEGGALSFNHEPYKTVMAKLRNFGISGPDSIDMTGTNAKMNEFQAAMGIVNLRYVEADIERRRQITQRYRNRLGSIEGMTFMRDEPGVKSNYSYFPLIIDPVRFGMSRDELHDRLHQYNIFTRKYFYPLISDLDSYRRPGDGERLVNAKYVAERILVLPLYSTLSDDMIDYICDSIEDISYAASVSASRNYLRRA